MPVARGHGERADVVRDAGRARRSRRSTRSAGRRAWPSAGGRAWRRASSRGPRLVRAQITMSSSGVALAGQNPTTADAREQPLVDDPREQRARVGVQLAGRGPDLGVGEDRRVGAAQLPGGEERRPVDALDELRERVVLERAHAQERRPGRRPRSSPADGRLARAVASVSRVSRSRRPSRSRRTCSYSSRIRRRVGVRGRRGRAASPRPPTARDASATWTTGDEYGGLDLDRRVDAGRRRAADQQRRRHPLALHQRRDVDHLVERRRDQARQADEVGVDLAGGLEDPRRPGTITPRSITS